MTLGGFHWRWKDDGGFQKLEVWFVARCGDDVKVFGPLLVRDRLFRLPDVVIRMFMLNE